MSDELKWTLWVGAAGALASLAARRMLDLGWVRVAGRSPRDDPSLARTSAAEAIGWSVAAAGVAGIARLLARRGAAAAWRRTLSSGPPTG
jgi:hypothetical protein